MSRIRRTRIVEDTWRCSSCTERTVNRGRDMKCKTCGSPKEAHEAYIPATSAAPTVTDSKMLREAKAGRHWECPYCKKQERNLNGECAQCGADKHQDRPKAPSRAVDLDDASYEPIPEPKPAPAPLKPSTLHSDFDYLEVKRTPVPVPVIAIAGIVVALVGILVWWAFTPSHHTAAVTTQRWHREVTLHQRVTHHDKDWREDMESGAYHVSCTREFKEWERCHPHDCRPHPESYSCHPHDCGCHESCHSNGNGYSTCHETCSTCYDTCTRTVYDTCWDRCQVFDDMCSYDYDTWPVAARRVLQGAGPTTTWETDLRAVDTNHRIEHEEEYTVVFTQDDDHWTYHPTSERQYTPYVVDSHWNIATNFGNVTPEGQVSSR